MLGLHRIAAFVLAALLIFTLLPFQSDANSSFEDVPDKSWYSAAVSWALEHGITTGTSATRFSPNESCTRAQIVTFLWRQAGSPLVADLENPFGDVKEGSFYYQAVLWALQQGITKGTSERSFSPGSPCTRAQIVTFLWRAAGSAVLDIDKSSLKDVESQKFYTMAVFWAIQNGITDGTSSTAFSPSAQCTRSQAVTFIYRCFSGVECTPNPKIHLYKLTRVSAACCTAPLTRSYRCVLCDQELTETEGEEAHNYILVSTSCATCTSPAIQKYRCSLCGACKTESSGKPLGHVFWVQNMSITQYPTPANPHCIGTKSCAYVQCTYTETFDELLKPHDSLSSDENALVSLINNARKDAGRSALSIETAYFDCSKWRAFECLAYVDSLHRRPNGQPFYTILDDLKLPRRTIGENVFYSAEENLSVKMIHNKFMASAPHKGNILDPEWTCCTVYILHFYDVTVCVEHFYA